tara:strand:+ start:24 stop:1247 length:1224 start_codon:yes stop_codon:yes gene_type:complete
MISKIHRFLFISYFPLFFIGVELSNQLNISWMKGILLLPAVVFGFYSFLFNILNKKKTSKNLYLLIFLQLLYGSFYLPHKYELFLSLVITFLLIGNVLFYYFITQSNFYKNNLDFLIYDFFKSVFICFFLTTIIPLFIIQDYKQFSDLGSAYNTKDVMFYMTTLNAPFLAAITMIYSFYIIYYKSQKFNLLYWVSFLLSFVSLILYSRRGPLFAAIFILLLLIQKKLLYRVNLIHLLFLMFAPFYWDFISFLLLEITQNNLVDSLIARNDVGTYLSATGRTYIWFNAINFMSDFNPIHFIGYGGMPNFLLTQTPLNHAHNGLFELFFESGFIVVSIFLVIYSNVLSKIKANLINDFFILLFALIIYWTILSMTEPTLRFTYFTGMFIIALLSIVNSYTEFKKLNNYE